MKTLAYLLALLILSVAHASIAAAQAPAPSSKANVTNPMIASGNMGYQKMKSWLLSSAEKMPEAEYGFKPAPAVRSFGQIVGHIADTHYRFCAVARGERNPNTETIEIARTAKADLIAALKGAFSYCDKVYDSLNDTTAVEMVKFGPMEHPRLGLLTFNFSHSALHYGNLITYMRLKNITPPSSETGALEPPKKG